ncbi:MAG: hypothetical protein AMXMBFR53_22060 [Gemmatimonadota bacterium]
MGAALLLTFLPACSPPVLPLSEAPAGEPLPGLSPQETGRFEAGRSLFSRAFTPEEGLGPLFNQDRCSSCHDLPTSGGHGAEPVTKATAFDPVAGCDRLIDGGGDLMQASVTPAARAAGLLPERFPEGATDATDLQPPALYGLGLAEAIPLESLAAAADPEDGDGDGISGRLGRSADGEAGRFGVKSTHASLASFIEEAARGELGLTTPLNPRESLPHGRPFPEGVDPTPEPEVDDALLALLADYVRFLAPPPPSVPDDAEGRAAVAEGRELFDALGCAACHTPVWTTGPHPSPVLSGRSFRAYSDFLLHDLGPELASVCAPGAARGEWRTTPLVGLGLRSVFLHDGRAQNLSSAVDLHGGEAARARDRFRALPQRARDDLIRFLQSL